MTNVHPIRSLNASRITHVHRTIAGTIAGGVDATTNDRAQATSRIISAVIASIIPTLALLYFLGLFLTYGHARRNPRSFNKSLGIRIYTYAPVVYVFMVIFSLVEAALAIWLLLQYHFNQNAPSGAMNRGTSFVLFAGCWTTLTGAALSILIIHPRWSKHPISSIGVQAIWVFVTWLFWVIGTGLVNRALPWLFSSGSCLKLPYCGQMQAFFALLVLEITMLTAGMLVMMYLSWKSSREALLPAEKN